MKKRILKRYRGLDGIVNTALDATILTAIISLAIIATV